MRRLSIFALILLSTAAEAAPPSLAKRPVEDRSMAEPVREVTPPAPADAALAARIAELVGRAEGGQRAFAELLPRARTAASGAGGEGSESWIAAQQLLTALESARAPNTSALSDIDTLIMTRLNGGGEVGLAELQAADARLSALAEAQQQELDTLRGRISR